MADEDLDDPAQDNADQANALGLSQNPLVGMGDPLYWSRARGTPEAPPNIVVRTQASPLESVNLHPQQANPLIQNRPPQLPGGGAPAPTNSAAQSGMDWNTLLQAQALRFANAQANPMGNSGSPASGGSTAHPEVEAYIRAQAPKYGVDPNVAVAVYKSEGASGGAGDENSSFGPYQLHYGGISKKYPNAGLGEAFTKETGLNARDPSTWQSQVDFALKHAAANGWGAWSGSRDSAGRFLGLPTEGIGEWYGINKTGPASGSDEAAKSAPQQHEFDIGQNAGMGLNFDPQKLWKFMLLQSLFPQVRFQHVVYNPWDIYHIGTRGY